jgi:hypothetical protein
VNEELSKKLDEEKIRAITALIPGEWLTTAQPGESEEEIREVYTQFLLRRLAASAIFLNEALHAREAII